MGQLPIRGSDFTKVPNLMTLARLVLTIPLIWAIFQHMYLTAFWLFWLASVTDALDGVIARAFDQRSGIGEILDLIADRFLMTPALIALFFAGYMEIIPFYPYLPALFAVPIIFGDITVLYGLSKFIPMKMKMPALEYPNPPPIGKRTFGIQVLAIMLMILSPTFDLEGVWMYLFVAGILLAAVMTLVTAQIWTGQAKWLFFGGDPKEHLGEMDESYEKK